MSDLFTELNSARRILLIRLRSLGDSILSLPLIDALHAWRRDLEVDVLVERPFAPVFAHHPSVHETLCLRPRGVGDGPGWSRLRAVREIRRRRYSAAFNLHGGSTSLWLSLASGARLRVGQRSYRQSWAYNVRIPPSSEIWGREKLHTVEHQLAPLRWLGIGFPEDPPLLLHVDPTARESVRRRLGSCSLRQGSFVLIHPSATLETKRWPADRFAQVGDALWERYGLDVVFTAALRETQLLERIKSAARRRHLYWNDLDLGALFALIRDCRLFVGNDSGPTHAAAALGKPIVVVWGSSNFDTWRPWGTRFEAVRSSLPCQPCPGYTCSAFVQPECILGAGVSEVLHRCGLLLAGAPEPEAP